jgi:hypothetical protein
MIKKTLMVLFFLMCLSHAASPAWHGTAVLAVIISVILLALLYAIGTGFQINTLQILAKEEFYQVLVLIVLIAALTGTDSIFNTISQTEELSGTDATMQDAAVTSIESTLSEMRSAMSNISTADNEIAKEASQGIQCSVLGIGYSVSGCGGFAMLSSPFALVGSILGFASGALYGALRLIQISEAYSLILLFPLGIILRTFRVTRGAGGLLIAVALSTYLLLPLGIILVDKFADAFEDSVTKLPSDDPDKAYFESSSSISAYCDPGGTNVGSFSNEARAIETYYELKSAIKRYLFLVLVKGTLGPAIALLMLISGIRVISAISGAEVDVSALARLV